MRNLTREEIMIMNSSKVGDIVHLSDVDLFVGESAKCTHCIGRYNAYNCRNMICQRGKHWAAISSIIGED